MPICLLKLYLFAPNATIWFVMMFYFAVCIKRECALAFLCVDRFLSWVNVVRLFKIRCCYGCYIWTPFLLRHQLAWAIYCDSLFNSMTLTYMRELNCIIQVSILAHRHSHPLVPPAACLKTHTCTYIDIVCSFKSTALSSITMSNRLYLLQTIIK